jgi:uncharacterized protein (TIGR02271 family)
MLRNIVGLFKSRKDAQNAQRDLHGAGFDKDTVTVINNDSDRLDQVFTGAGMQNSDTIVYRDGLRRGETVVMARTDQDAHIEQAGDIFDRHQPVNIERRQRELTDGGVLSIPVIEEELRVGKRVVERGGVRIFVHVETIPVEVPVTLRDETISVERRPVDQVIDNPDAILDQQQQSAELREIDEEPVVEKRVVVKEELVIRKDVEERTETIRDTVRRTDVDVEETSGSINTTNSLDQEQALGDTNTRRQQ